MIPPTAVRVHAFGHLPTHGERASLPLQTLWSPLDTRAPQNPIHTMYGTTMEYLRRKMLTPRQDSPNRSSLALADERLGKSSHRSCADCQYRCNNTTTILHDSNEILKTQTTTEGARHKKHHTIHGLDHPLSEVRWAVCSFSVEWNPQHHSTRRKRI